MQPQSSTLVKLSDLYVCEWRRTRFRPGGQERCVACRAACSEQFFTENRAAIIARLEEHCHKEWERIRARVRETNYQRNRWIAETDDGTITPAEWQSVLDAYDNRCAYCGVAGVVLARDHVVPLARGGRNTIGNVVPACKPCNSSKQARVILKGRQFLLRI